jgi:hypothetical protein
MKLIGGNTYKHRDEIKRAGGLWDRKLNCWRVPDDQYSRILALVSAGANTQPTRRADKSSAPRDICRPI